MDSQDSAVSLDSGNGKSIFVCEEVDTENEIRKANNYINKIRKDMTNLNNFLLHLKEQHTVIEMKIQALENKRQESQEKLDNYLQINSLKCNKIKRAESQSPKQLIQNITDADFNSIPRYTRGRLTLKEINEFVDAYNQEITVKYGLKIMKLYMEQETGNQNREISTGERPSLSLREMRCSGRLSAGANAAKAAGVLRFLGSLDEVRDSVSGRQSYAPPCSVPPQHVPQPRPCPADKELSAPQHNPPRPSVAPHPVPLQVPQSALTRRKDKCFTFQQDTSHAMLSSQSQHVSHADVFTTRRRAPTSSATNRNAPPTTSQYVPPRHAALQSFVPTNRSSHYFPATSMATRHARGRPQILRARLRPRLATHPLVTFGHSLPGHRHRTHRDTSRNAAPGHCLRHVTLLVHRAPRRRRLTHVSTRHSFQNVDSLCRPCHKTSRHRCLMFPNVPTRDDASFGRLLSETDIF